MTWHPRHMKRLGNLARTLLRRTVPPVTPRSATDPHTGPRPGAPQDGVHYAPAVDGSADPGEVVWAWVSYDDDPGQGKDRPVLVIGREGSTLLALQLTSQDHDVDAEDEARYGRFWMDIGSGEWDRQRRPSEVRLDRLLRLEESAVRRERAVLDRARFDAVLREARAHHDFG
jgi:hypothetical protein